MYVYETLWFHKSCIMMTSWQISHDQGFCGCLVGRPESNATEVVNSHFSKRNRLPWVRLEPTTLTFSYQLLYIEAAQLAWLNYTYKSRQSNQSISTKHHNLINRWTPTLNEGEHASKSTIASYVFQSGEIWRKNSCMYITYRGSITMVLRLWEHFIHTSVITYDWGKVSCPTAWEDLKSSGCGVHRDERLSNVWVKCLASSNYFYKYSSTDACFKMLYSLQVRNWWRNM